MKLLEQAGFEKLLEKQSWNLKKGGSYFFTRYLRYSFLRNQSSIVAFSVGGNFKPSGGFTVVGAHTDSPNLKVKPVSRASSQNYLQVGVEPYGGGLWHTWFDRDLTLAGRVFVRKGDSVQSQLVSVGRPILRVPTLAIHLDREVNEALKFNKQDHLLPVLATAAEGELNASSNHHSVLLDLLASELGCKQEDIVNFDLSLCDSVPPVIGGVKSEFIFSPRLDNLMMSFCSLSGLLESLPTLPEEVGVRMVLLFDHEEIGSQSAYGADSTLVSEAMDRVVDCFEGSLEDTMMADMAHGVHPNYAGKHEELHRPRLGHGPVIKTNANQRYTTTAETAAILLELGRLADVPLQQFVVRNDSLCGSTIGPMLAAKTGIRTVDIGNPQLSMHSIREMCHVADVDHAVNLLSTFFSHFHAVDSKFTTD